MLDADAKILVVHEQDMMRRIAKMSLESLGFSNVVEANDGEEAWKVLINANPPVEFIMANWNAKKWPGIKLLKMIHKDENYRDIAFLMITESTDKNEILEASKAGVSGYIVHPFTVDALGEKIEHIFKEIEIKS